MRIPRVYVGGLNPPPVETETVPLKLDKFILSRLHEPLAAQRGL